MSNETRKGLIRIVSNYMRLILTLVLGLSVVPLTLRWLGEDAFGIISLLGANFGLAGIFSQIISMSIVRELAQAYHKDDETFRVNYSVICMVTLIFAALSLLSFAIIYAIVPVFKISPDFIGPARWFVVGQASITTVRIILSPVLNMYLVKEMFIGYNIWFVGVRATNIISVLVLGYVFAIDDPKQGLLALGVLWAVLSILGFGIAVAALIRLDPRLKFRYSFGNRESRSQVMSTFSWNTCVQIAMNLHQQVPQLLLNLFFGTLANAAWGIGFRFVSYIRMVTTGVQFGSDAVSARLASGEDSEKARKQLQRLINIQTKLTTLVALPAATGIFLYCWPIYHAWVGFTLDSYSEVMTAAVYMSRILTIALVSRAVSDTWLIILYGAGYVRSYAPWVFAGGLAAPVASIILMFVLPESVSMYAPPAMFAFVLFTVHFLGLPFIVGKCLQVNPYNLFTGVLLPFFATLIAAAAGMGVLAAAGHVGDLGLIGSIDRERASGMSAVAVISSIIVFGLVYAALSYAIVLSADERKRISGLLMRRKKV